MRVAIYLDVAAISGPTPDPAYSGRAGGCIVHLIHGCHLCGAVGTQGGRVLLGWLLPDDAIAGLFGLPLSEAK